MSNTSIMSVREMIENAFGEAEVNTVNFKLIQAILYLLARQLRVLERQVGVEIGFVPGAEATDSTLSVTEVNISATVPKKNKGRGVALLNKVLTSTPKVTQSTLGGEGGITVFERMSRISRVSAYDVQTSRKNAEEVAEKGRKSSREESGESKPIKDSDTRKRRESAPRYTDDDSHSTKRGRSESEKDRYGDESDVSDQFDDSRQRETGKSEKENTKKQKGSKKQGAEGKSGVGVTGGKGGAEGRINIDEAEKKTRKGMTLSSSSESKIRKLQKILNNLELERERVLRVIQQRTDSKVGESSTPTPIASMDSMEVQYEKLLILERVSSKEVNGKAKKNASDQPRLSIVTHEQFYELVKQVEILEKKFGYPNTAEYGENANLMEELRKGASLTDAMAALQLSARIETAENALQNMIALLTELSKRGPPKRGKPGAQDRNEGKLLQSEVEKGRIQGQKGEIGKWQQEMEQKENTHSEIDVLTGKAGKGKSKSGTGAKSLDQVLTLNHKESQIVLNYQIKVKKVALLINNRMYFLIYWQRRNQRINIKKMINKQQKRRNMETLLLLTSYKRQLEKSGNLGDRLATLELAASDYIEQINILDTGLSSQMTNYQEQLTQMQHELEIGLENMAEALATQGGDSDAVSELNMRLSALQTDFDKSRSMQLELGDVQTGLTLDLEALWKQIEQLRGIKSDRDEVADALRDKAGIGILNGLVTLNQFDAVRGDLEKRICAAYDKFNNQEFFWQKAIDDLTREINEKAEYTQVVALRDDVNKNLDMLRSRIENMLDLLGEPRTKDLAKTIYRDAPCLSCSTPSPFVSEEWNLAVLPPMKARPLTIGEEATLKRKGEGDHGACYFGQPIPHASDPRARVCTRYCGSSVLPSTKLQKEPVNININALTRQPSLGVGPDGKPCVIDEKLLRVPCTPCNTTAIYAKSVEKGDKPEDTQLEEDLQKTEEIAENASMQPEIQGSMSL